MARTKQLHLLLLNLPHFCEVCTSSGFRHAHHFFQTAFSASLCTNLAACVKLDNAVEIDHVTLWCNCVHLNDMNFTLGLSMHCELQVVEVSTVVQSKGVFRCCKFMVNSLGPLIKVCFLCANVCASGFQDDDSPTFGVSSFIGFFSPGLK